MFAIADVIMVAIFSCIVALGVYGVRRKAASKELRDKEKELRNALAEKERCDIERLPLHELAARMSERSRNKRK